jgi:uridine phosphorylase
LAGALQASAKAGDLVIATQAIPDDGVSPHYLAESPGAVRSTGLADGLAQSLEAAGHRYQLGTCWSTSAPYREGRCQLARHQAEGAVAVDMEAAALYAVAGRLGILACAALVISDSLADGNWEPSPNSRDQEQGLRRLVDAAILAMAG